MKNQIIVVVVLIFVALVAVVARCGTDPAPRSALPLAWDVSDADYDRWERAELARR